MYICIWGGELLNKFGSIQRNLVNDDLCLLLYRRTRCSKVRRIKFSTYDIEISWSVQNIYTTCALAGKGDMQFYHRVGTLREQYAQCRLCWMSPTLSSNSTPPPSCVYIYRWGEGGGTCLIKKVTINKDDIVRTALGVYSVSSTNATSSHLNHM